MARNDSTPVRSQGAAEAFVTTRWSIILRVGAGDEGAARHALEQLCSTYWYPLYTYLRRDGHSPQDAEDLAQGFCLHLLSKDFIERAHPDKGRFRSYLLRALQLFVSNERDKGRAQKRGGDRTFISLDAQDAEERFRFEPVDRLDPEKLYQRRWALALLERVFGRLEKTYVDHGREAVFACLNVYLREGKDAGRYADAAAALGMAEGAVKVEVFRMRKTFRELFREEVAHTLEHTGEIEDEVRHLCNALRG